MVKISCFSWCLGVLVAKIFSFFFHLRRIKAA